jgi:hypothetical protein
MNRTLHSSFATTLLAFLAMLCLSTSSFAQNDGSQFADESYAEEELAQAEDKSMPADEPADESEEEDVDVWSKEEQSDDDAEDERA